MGAGSVALGAGVVVGVIALDVVVASVEFNLAECIGECTEHFVGRVVLGEEALSGGAVEVDGGEGKRGCGGHDSVVLHVEEGAVGAVVLQQVGEGDFDPPLVAAVGFVPGVGKGGAEAATVVLHC